MSSRAHLHDLTRQLRRYLSHQRANGVRAYVPASADERADFDARREAIKERQLADIRSHITGNSTSGDDEEQEHNPAEAASSPSGAGFSPGVDDKGSSQSESAAVTAETELWKKHDAIHQLRQKPQTRADEQNDTGSSSRASGDRAANTEDPGSDSPSETPKTAAEKMEYLRHYLGDCQRCPLHENRSNIVFGTGDPDARLMFVGEGPGYHEDQQGLPFVGKSGKLLTKMIRAMGLTRDEVYITNIVKCRPPDNRDPAPTEVKECSPFLKKQIEVVEPEVIVTLGRPAANTLLGTEDQALGRLRARWHEHRGVEVMPTYHPSYLLRTEPDTTYKKRAWSDLQMVMERLDLG